MLRTSGTIPKKSTPTSAGGETDGEPYRHYGGLQPAAGEVHIDTEPSRQLAYAKKLHERSRPGGPGFKRFIMSSFWRTFSPPPSRLPTCSLRCAQRQG